MTDTFVLVPGAGGDSHYWHLVAPLLREAGHEVIAPDLPAGDPGAGLAEYADAIVAAAGESERIVLVAQSMGALSAPLACDRLDVRAMVLVAPMIPAPGETGGEWWSATGQERASRELARREGRDPDAPFDLHEIFLHDVPQPVVDDLLARGAPRQEGRSFEDPWPLAAWPDVPTRVIAGRHDRLLPLELVRRLARERLGVEAEVVDAGHLPALAAPAELAGMLLYTSRMTSHSEVRARSLRTLT
jgi:pimeloyl-ACP methyl ester carboxylesterase